MKEYYPRMAWSINTISSLGYIFWGYSLGVSNSVLNYIEKYIFPNISVTELSLLASMLTIGAIIGSKAGSKLSTKFGRMKVLVLGDFIALIGVGLTMVQVYGVIIAGRLLQGFTVGINSSVALVYSIEMCPKAIRGAAVNVNFVALPIGVTIAYLLGFLVPDQIAEGSSDNAWRLCYAVNALFPLIRIIMIFSKFRFETPFWLYYHEKKEQCRAVLQKIYTQKIDELIEEIQMDVDKVFKSKEGQVSFFDLFKKKYRKIFMVSLMVNLVHQLSGSSPVFVFGQQIFGEGIDEDESSDLPNILSTVVAFLNLMFTAVSVLIVQKFGRKRPFVLGVLLMGILSIVYSIIGYADSQANIAAKIMIVLWPTVFSWSSGGVSFLYIGEVLPDIGVSTIVLINWVLNFLITQFSLDIANNIGWKGLFLIFAIYDFGTAFLSQCFMIESKDKTKAEMLELYHSSKKTQVHPAQGSDNALTTEAAVHLENGSSGEGNKEIEIPVQKNEEETVKAIEVEGEKKELVSKEE